MQIKGVPNLGAFQVAESTDSKNPREEKHDTAKKKARPQQKKRPSEKTPDVGVKIISPSSELIPDCQIIDSQSVVDLLGQPPAPKNIRTAFKNSAKKPSPAISSRRKIDRSA